MPDSLLIAKEKQINLFVIADNDADVCWRSDAQDTRYLALWWSELTIEKSL